jgi:hypothetical protein
MTAAIAMATLAAMPQPAKRNNDCIPGTLMPVEIRESPH